MNGERPRLRLVEGGGRKGVGDLSRPAPAPAPSDVADVPARRAPYVHPARTYDDHRYASSGSDMLAGLLSSVLLTVALLLGGSTRNDQFSDLLVQLLAAVLLVYGLRRLNWGVLDAGNRQLLVLAAIVLVVPILQLLPLPTALSQGIAGRAELWNARAALGLEVPAFVPWSLDPNATLAALRSLLPAAAMVVLGCQLNSAWLKRMAALALLIAVVMVPIGVAQVAQGPQSELRPYVPTNVHDAVGLFANRNHYAALLAAALALVFVGILSQGRSSRSTGWLRRVGLMLLGAILLLGLVLSRSRAGVGLAGAMSIAMLLLAFVRRREHPRTFRWLLAFVLLGGLVAFQFGFLAIADRLAQQHDQRWDVTAGVFTLAADYSWLGTGLGSFAAAYATHEPLELLGAQILNHAHNDWAELWVELGLGLVPIALFGAVWLWARVRELFAVGMLGRAEQSLRLAGVVIILTLSAHSLVDYPLRTTALSVLLAFACVLSAHPLSSPGRLAGHRP